MAKTPYAEHFSKLVDGYEEAEICRAAGIKHDAYLRLRDGKTAEMKLAAGLRLAHFLGISPWALADIIEPLKAQPMATLPVDVPLGTMLVPTAEIGELRELIQGLPQDVADMKLRLLALEGDRSPQRALPVPSVRSK